MDEKKDSYSAGAEYYDAIYSFKDYRSEAEYIAAIAKRKLGEGRLRLLDVACGTGRHISCFSELGLHPEGIDLSSGLLEIARNSNPGISFSQCDMTNFHLGKSYELITCLFGAIGYTLTRKSLNNAVSCMAEHLIPGGLLMVEPWFTPDQWRPDTVHASIVDEPELKVVRMNTSKVAGKTSILELHYLVGTPRETRYFSEMHEMGLFTAEEMAQAFSKADMSVEYHQGGYPGRGLYIAEKR